MTPDRETLAAWMPAEVRQRVDATAWEAFHSAHDGARTTAAIHAGADEAWRAALAGPLAPAPPSDGEADEAARLLQNFAEMDGGMHYECCDVLEGPDEAPCDCRLGEHVLLILADREAWRDRAFRAFRQAMEPEGGGQVAPS